MATMGLFSCWSILVLAGFGIIVNLASIVILVSKGRNQMFHHLLKIMAVYDLVVVLGCGLLYSLPKLAFFSGYSKSVFPVILPWLLPIVQIAMMSSVYCTIVMSFERYIRICRLCQLRQCSYITKKNFKYYVIAIVVLPIMFYIPKFFEVRSHSIIWPYTENIDCRNFVLKRLRTEQQQDEWQNSTFLSENRSSNSDFKLDNISTSFDNLEFHKDCEKFNFSFDGDDDFRRNVTTNGRRWKVMPTELRRNQMYYKVYCIGLNTFFASLLPMSSLLFLNVSTVLTLRKMSIQQDAVQTTVTNGRQKPDRRPRKILGCFKGSFVQFTGVRFSYRESEPTCLETTTIRLQDNANKRGGSLRRYSQNDPAGNQLKRSRSQSAHNLGELLSSHQRPAKYPMIVTTDIDQSRKAIPDIVVTRSDNENDVIGSIQNDVTETDHHGTVDAAPSPIRFFLNHLNAKRCRRHTTVDIAAHRSSRAAMSRTSIPASHSNSDLRSRENRLTRISLSIVWLFIFCHMWKLIPTIYEGVHEMGWDASAGKKLAAAAWPEWLSVINDISHTLIVFNSAVNFLIYVTL